MIGQSQMNLTFTCRVIEIDYMVSSRQSLSLQKLIVKLSVNLIAKKNSWPNANTLTLNKLLRSCIGQDQWKI